MIVMLPRKGDLPAVEKGLTARAVNEAVGKLTLHRGSVALPRFKVTAVARLEDDLSRMGMPIAFSSAADFSGMVRDRELFIGKVLHQAQVAVDEFGTEP